MAVLPMRCIGPVPSWASIGVPGPAGAWKGGGGDVDCAGGAQLDGRSLLVREDQGSGPPRQGGYEDRPGGSRAFAPRGGGDSGGRGGGSSGGAKVLPLGYPWPDFITRC